MTRRKQVNSVNGAVLNRDFSKRSRYLIIIKTEGLMVLFLNVKFEYINLVTKPLGYYRIDGVEIELNVFGNMLVSVILEYVSLKGDTRVRLL